MQRVNPQFPFYYLGLNNISIDLSILKFILAIGVTWLMGAGITIRSISFMLNPFGQAFYSCGGITLARPAKCALTTPGCTQWRTWKQSWLYSLMCLVH